MVLFEDRHACQEIPWDTEMSVILDTWILVMDSIMNSLPETPQFISLHPELRQFRMCDGTIRKTCICMGSDPAASSDNRQMMRAVSVEKTGFRLWHLKPNISEAEDDDAFCIAIGHTAVPGTHLCNRLRATVGRLIKFEIH